MQEFLMDDISTILTMVAAVSVSVERVTEILKQMIPALAMDAKDEKAENRRRAALQILAGLIGTVIAWQGNLQLGSHGGWWAYAVIGAMSSGGSAFWNHALDALRATKITQEATADEKSLQADALKAAAAKAAAPAPAVP
jgi:hypothetical protein